MIYFDQGLVTRADPVTENRNLFYAQYLVLGGVNQGFNQFMHEKQLPNGMYLRSTIHTKRTVSHDEISGWMISSYLLKTGHKNEIWKTLKDNYGAYPAVVLSWSDKIPFNPGNYYAWGLYAESRAAYLFLPMYAVNLFIVSYKAPSNTSSKIIYWMELETMPKNIFNDAMKSFYKARMVSQYGKGYVGKLLRFYHAAEADDFPIFQELKKYEALNE